MSIQGEMYEEALADHRRLVRELDVILNGDGAAPQASLVDIVSQCRKVFTKPPFATDVPLVELWRGERKVTIYRDTVIRSWGTNIETEMSDEPRTAQADQAALDWLYETL